MHKIAIFSFGNYGKFLRYIVEHSKEAKLNIEWSVIANNYQAVTHFTGTVQPERIKYLYDGFNEKFESYKNMSFKQLASYNYASSSNLWRALAVDKVHYKKKAKEFQIQHGLAVYESYKQALNELKPQFVLFPIIESHDGFILYDLCQELGIEPIVYAHARNMGTSFFTNSYQEYLPPYAMDITIEDHIRNKAEKFLTEFRANYKSAFRAVNLPTGTKFIETEPEANALTRLVRNLIATSGKEKYNLRINYWIKSLVYIQKYRNKYLQWKYKKQEKHFDLNDLKQLPNGFVYLPLQFSPESSINVPNPFYIDQMRVIDEVVLNLSKGRYVVVKEHPAMMGTRSESFYKELKRKPGVLTISAGISSMDLIKRADLVVSVTGTAVLEAFLSGKPCCLLGDNFLSPFLKENNKEIYCDEEIEEFLRRVFACSGDFIMYSPGAYTLKQTDLFNQDNVCNFTNHLCWHIKKVIEYRCEAND